MSTTTGRVTWFEVASTDMEASAQFYGGLFGWTFRGSPSVYLAVEPSEGSGGIPGGLMPAPAGVGPYALFGVEAKTSTRPTLARSTSVRSAWSGPPTTPVVSDRPTCGTPTARCSPCTGSPPEKVLEAQPDHHPFIPPDRRRVQAANDLSVLLAG